MSRGGLAGVVGQDEGGFGEDHQQLLAGVQHGQADVAVHQAQGGGLE